MNETPTISDLADALGLSISSVSYALNGRKGVSEATRKRVVDYAARVGYRANSSARALSRARTSSIGIVVREDLAVIRTEPYYQRFLAGIASVLEGTDTELLVKLTDSGLDEELAVYRRWAAERRVDGVILLDERLDDPRADLLRSLGMPALLHGTTPPTHRDLPSVLIDDARDAATLVSHLAEQGCQRVLHAAGPARHRHETRRLESVELECRARGLGYEPVAGTYTLEQGEHVADTLAASAPQRPDAVIAANDLVAVGVCRRLADLGVDVPGQCRVVAWDSSILCEIVRPGISALDRRPERCGARAAQILLDHLAGQPGDPVPPPDVVGASELIVRGSSRPGPTDL